MHTSWNRRAAFLAGIGFWTLSIVWLAPLFDSPPASPVTNLVALAICAALATSAVLLEVRRSLVAPAAALGDGSHFRWVLFWASVLFVLQFTGMKQALPPVG